MNVELVSIALYSNIYQTIVGDFPVELRYQYSIMSLRMILELQLHF